MSVEHFQDTCGKRCLNFWCRGSLQVSNGLCLNNTTFDNLNRSSENAALQALELQLNNQKWSAMIDSVISLPFNRHIGIQKSSTGEGLLELPAGEQFHNHIGTVHAGAQLALAEACSGEFLISALANQLGILPVVRRVEAKFKSPAHGRVTAKINSSMTAVEASLAELAAKGRCLLTIHVDVHDQQGQHSLASSFEWFIAKRILPGDSD